MEPPVYRVLNIEREWHVWNIILIFVMMVNLDNSSSATSVGLGLEDLLHLNNNNNEITKDTTENSAASETNSPNQDQAKSINIEKVGWVTTV